MLGKHLMILYLLMTSGFVVPEPSGKSTDKICDEFQNHIGDKLNIQMVGLATSRLILLTKSYYVYDVPRSNMDSSINNLYLESHPVEMKNKYPTLWNHHDFIKIKDEIFNGFMMNFNGGDNICLTTDSTKTQDKGVNYNLDNNKVGVGWSFEPGSKHSIQEALISTDHPGTFYAIRSGTHDLSVSKYEYKSKTDTIDMVKDYRPICFGSTQKEIYVAGKDETCKKPVQYPTLTGFVINGRFILFSSTFVLSFDESIVQGDGKQTTTLKETSYKDFFTCPGQVPPSTDHTALIFIIIAIVLLLLVLCCCLCIIFYTYIRKKRKNERRKKPRYGKGSGKKPPPPSSTTITAADTVATVRSLGNSTGTLFGMLSAKSHAAKSSKPKHSKSKSKKKSKSKSKKSKKSKSNKSSKHKKKSHSNKGKKSHSAKKKSHSNKKSKKSKKSSKKSKPKKK